MKKDIFNSNSGVTLLEIMLVLAVSVSIISLSIHYYNSAVSSQRANSTVEQVMLISSTIDRVSSAYGGAAYQNVLTTNANGNSSLNNMLPSGTLTTAWGTPISFDNINFGSYDVKLSSMPASICPLVYSQLSNNRHFHVTSACSDEITDFKYTYLYNA